MNKLFEYFSQYPEKWTHIRLLAKILFVSPNTIRKWATELLKKGLIMQENTANLIQYRACMDSQKFIHQKRVFNLASIYNSGLFDYLQKIYPSSTIILYGSYSRGEDISSSDIDIAVFSSEKKTSFATFEEKLHRTIQLLHVSKESVSKEFLTNVYNGIVLQGVVKS